MAGAWLARAAFKAIKKKTSYEEYGGSLLLGVNGICVIAHGSSSVKAIRNAIRVAVEAIEHGVNDRIIRAAEIAGLRALVVHAKDEAARSFYERFDFVPSPSDPLHLFVLIKDLKRILGK